MVPRLAADERPQVEHGCDPHLVIHSDLEGEAQVVSEVLLLGDVLADLAGRGGRVHHDRQALSVDQDDVDGYVLLGLDSLVGGGRGRTTGRLCSSGPVAAQPDRVSRPDSHTFKGSGSHSWEPMLLCLCVTVR